MTPISKAIFFGVIIGAILWALIWIGIEQAISIAHSVQ